MVNFSDFEQARVLVIGDVMLDRFWQGTATRISPEAPVPVVKVASVDDRPGGAGNVAINLAALGVQTTLSGLVGDDEYAAGLREVVEARGVRWSVMPCASETIVKLRVLSQNQQLIRMDFEGSFASFADEVFVQFASNLIVDHDVVVLSDYAKGTLNSIELLISACRKQSKPVLVDPKGNDFERYRGATILTPNLSEFEAVVGACHQSDERISQEARALCHRLDFEGVLVTRSERGLTWQPKVGEALHLPAAAREVFDVTGAGDTVIATIAAGIASGSSFENATRWANSAAGLVVGKVGTAVVTREELTAEIESHEGLERDRIPDSGVVSPQTITQVVEQLKARRKRIVMTNGCFDLLHPGHVAYLAQARELGDALIVAVNDDPSVSRLKGPDRPINDLAARMSVLAGLRVVTYVVPFSEDTPEQLINRISPDVLVKGGDYTVPEIAGHESVIARGGEVVILDFVDGHSTTATIARIADVGSS